MLIHLWWHTLVLYKCLWYVYAVPGGITRLLLLKCIYSSRNCCTIVWYLVPGIYFVFHKKLKNVRCVYTSIGLFSIRRYRIELHSIPVRYPSLVYTCCCRRLQRDTRYNDITHLTKKSDSNKKRESARARTLRPYDFMCDNPVTLWWYHNGAIKKT